MSDQKPKRPWFRFHLLTLVLMALAAGTFLGANMRERLGDRKVGEWRCYGWPFDVAEVRGVITFSISGEPDPIIADPFDPVAFGPQYNGANIALNCMMALSVLAAVAFVSEFLIRRREARKT
jgi:hypothetical protein